MHIGMERTERPTVSLKRLHEVKNVNALAEGQSLSFITKGVTIVYGDNGSGKSGYVRILKNACRTRTTKGKMESILPNVYEESTGIQCAKLKYQAGTGENTAEWKNDTSTDSLLSEVSVFDSNAANVHVEETNDLAYTPFPMKVLERLANTCMNVRVEVNSMIESIECRTPRSISKPSCSPNSKVGVLLTSLSKDTKLTAVTELAELSDDEKGRLSELTATFSQDSKVAARRLDDQISKLESLKLTLGSLAETISAENTHKLRCFMNDFKSKNDAVNAASKVLFSNAAFEEIGSRAWRLLWEAAREFSINHAYKFGDFPMVEGDARCVLCHQKLDKSSVYRFEAFETFVQGKVQKQADAAQEELRKFKKNLMKMGMNHNEYMKVRTFLTNDVGNETLTKSFREFAVCVRWRLRQMLREDHFESHATPTFPYEEIETMISELKSQLGVLMADNDDDRRRLLQEELIELKDREWLSGIKDDVIAEIDRHREIQDLKVVLREANSRSITSKNDALSETLVTEQLRVQFLQEIAHLGLEELAIELTQEKSKHGVTRFKVSLAGNNSADAGKVLSEGEYRCVALASFLAELAICNSDSGIIFDDPVSSLDHLHREAIANRLATLGRSRQVVVFTHDLPFLFMLQRACRQAERHVSKTAIAFRHIQRVKDRSGHCADQTPHKTMKPSDKVKKLKTHLSNVSDQHKLGSEGVEWLVSSLGIVTDIRRTWEAAVEDTISPVLSIFSNKVDTKNFAKLSAITESDAIKMRLHYGQCSKLLHSISKTINPKAPSPDDVLKEIEALETWIEDISERQRCIKANH